jgi:hypothetical protein
VRRRSRARSWPSRLARFRESDWLDAPLTDEERNTFGYTVGIAGGMADVARSRWLWARWEHADSAGQPDAIDYFVEWLQGPPCGR